MKYSCEVIIELSVSDVMRLMKDHQIMKRWQPDLKSITLEKGEALKTGAVSKIIYEYKGKDIEIVETILNHTHNSYEALYESKQSKNWYKNDFTDLGNRTLWRCDNLFKMTGVMKLLELFGKPMFKKKTYKDMLAFKRIVENLS